MYASWCLEIDRHLAAGCGQHAQCLGQDDADHGSGERLDLDGEDGREVAHDRHPAIPGVGGSTKDRKHKGLSPLFGTVPVIRVPRYS